MDDREREHLDSRVDLAYLSHRRESVGMFRRLLHEPEFFDGLVPQGRGPEAVWQAFFEDNHWIFGGSLAGQFLVSFNAHRMEQVVTGQSIIYVGKRADALMRTTGIVRSLVVVEIKHHRTKLLGTQYRRGSWSPSRDLCGAVAQVQETIQDAVAANGARISDCARDGSDVPGAFTYLLQPRSFLIVGSLNEMIGEAGGINHHKYQSFELYRRRTQEPGIVTFDELLARAEGLVEAGGE